MCIHMVMGEWEAWGNSHVKEVGMNIETSKVSCIVKSQENCTVDGRTPFFASDFLHNEVSLEY